MTRAAPKPRATRAGFLRATLVGGVVFLLPFGIVLVVFAKLFEVFRPVGQAIRHMILPTGSHEPAATLLTALVLVALAFGAGLLARSLAGRWVFERIEAAVLLRFPAYTMFRSAIRAQTDGQAKLAESADAEIVLVRFDDMTSVGVFVERLSDGQAVVYLPGAPSATSGSVAIVEASRLTPTKLTTADVFGRMRQLGIGLDQCLSRG